MNIARGRLPGLCVALASLACAATSLAADPTIRLTGVPEPLEFPLPPGSNAVLTAHVEGGAARSVWLAANPASLRLPLTAVGPGEYAVNLSDPALSRVIDNSGADNAFQVFAETVGGRTIASIPIRFARRKLELSSLEIWAVAPNGVERRLEPAAPRPYGVFAPPQPGRNDPAQGGDRWCDPLDTARLELRCDLITPRSTAMARSLVMTPSMVEGIANWDFRPNRPGRLSLELDDDIRATWSDNGAIEVFIAMPPGSRQKVATIRAVPGAIKATAVGAAHGGFRIPQRRADAVPGCNEYWWLQLNDVTGAGVRVRLVAADGGAAPRELNVSTGDVIPLRLRGGSYVIAVEHVVNLLIGDDYTAFKVFTDDEWKLEKARRVERLIRLVTESDATFVRNDSEYSGVQAAAHLRRKLDASGLKDPSPTEFIDAVASKSSSSGKPYLIRMRGSEPVELKAWLRGQLPSVAELPQPAAAGATSQPFDEP